MATAVEPSPTPSTPSKPLSLPIASLLGAVYVAAALAVVFFAVPIVWKENVASVIGTSGGVGAGLRVTIQLAIAVGLIWFGSKLAGGVVPKGVRAGTFLMIAFALVIAVIVRWVAMSFESEIGKAITAVLALGLLYLAVRFFMGRMGERWMVSLEEQGWFSTALYKRSLGVRVRRLTTLGIGLIVGTGIWAVRGQGLLPHDLTLAMPFGLSPITFFSDAEIIIPVLAALLGGWIAWRAVNVPDFAEFLIATEAEMNKVSWSSRSRLFQDTVVVLLTTLIMTLFLLVVDLFWGWLLSRPTVGVLPARVTNAKGDQVKEAKW